MRGRRLGGVPPHCDPRLPDGEAGRGGRVGGGGTGSSGGESRDLGVAGCAGLAASDYPCPAWAGLDGEVLNRHGVTGAGVITRSALFSVSAMMSLP